MTSGRREGKWIEIDWFGEGMCLQDEGILKKKKKTLQNLLPELLLKDKTGVASKVNWTVSWEVRL